MPARISVMRSRILQPTRLAAVVAMALSSADPAVAAVEPGQYASSFSGDVPGLSMIGPNAISSASVSSFMWTSTTVSADLG
jgi:hypothetical protein